MDKHLNLKNPQTFTEKMRLLKLYDHNSLYHILINKYSVKEYVAKLISRDHIIPALGVWYRFDEVDFDSLPNQLVLKTTSGGGNSGMVICKDKSIFDKVKAKRLLETCAKNDIYQSSGEWSYKGVKPRIIAEQFISAGPELKDLSDYKWLCFDGEPKFCQVIQNRTSKETIDFFNTKWEHQEFIGLNPKAIHAEEISVCPKGLDNQICIARKLSKSTAFSRINFYEVNEKEYFGEITFYPVSGFGQFEPAEYDLILGQMFTLLGEKMEGGKFVIPIYNNYALAA